MSEFSTTSPEKLSKLDSFLPYACDDEAGALEMVGFTFELETDFMENIRFASPEAIDLIVQHLAGRRYEIAISDGLISEEAEHISDEFAELQKSIVASIGKGAITLRQPDQTDHDWVHYVEQLSNVGYEVWRPSGLAEQLGVPVMRTSQGETAPDG